MNRARVIRVFTGSAAGRSTLRELRAQPVLDDLARRVARHFADHEPVRRLVVGDQRQCVRAQFFQRDGLARARRDDGDDALAVVRVRLADDRAVEHLGMRRERVLDLDRVNVHPAGDDHVLLAVDQRDAAVGVDAREVAGVEPPVAQRLGGRLGFVPVPLHDRLAAQDHFADLARGDVAPVVVDDADFGVHDRPAVGAGAVEDVVGAEHHAAGAAAASRSISAGGIGAAPNMPMRQAARSRVAKSGWSSMNLYIVGTPKKALTRSDCIVARTLAGSNTGSSTWVAPTSIPPLRNRFSSAEWYSGATCSSTSPSRIPTAMLMLAPSPTTRCWSSSTPLGLPVVPEV